MIRSLLFDVLTARESFFFHFQPEYRKYKESLRHGLVSEWQYDSLKSIVKRFSGHPDAERLYLIIDAVDESTEEDRRDILNLLLELCSDSKHCTIKVFIASRPIGLLESRIPVSDIIRLQDENKPDIEQYALSCLKGAPLSFTGDILRESIDHIVTYAEGVFLWTHLVMEELSVYAETGYSSEEIFDVLKSLPKELEELYELILSRLLEGKPRDITVGIRLFQFILFAARSPTNAEVAHALAIPESPVVSYLASDELFKRALIQDVDKRIIHCGGNLLEIKHSKGAIGRCYCALSSLLS